jgi:hypothetical protein
LSDVLDKIRESIKEAQANGYTIMRRGWIRTDTRMCCPLGSTILEEHKELSISVLHATSKKLGVSIGWIQGFVAGFDSNIEYNINSSGSCSDGCRGKGWEEGLRAGITIRDEVFKPKTKTFAE